jgi:hypothetical protein
MRPKTFALILCLLCALCGASRASAQIITPPASYFGFEPGADRQMINYGPLMDYLHLLESESGRIRLEQVGESEFGRPIYIAFISSEENIRRLDELREINRRLALDPDIPEGERARLIEQGRVFIFATLSMHATEVGPSQAAPRMAYTLIEGTEPGMDRYLQDVVFMMNPSHNPDGMDLVVDHYKQYLDTPYEGSSLPGLYHKYVGHNINRDFITLTQKENQAIADAYNLEWFPQVLVEKHQMGATGVRYFVPPNHDPIAENIDENLWSWTWVFGSNMARDMTARGLTGISQHYLFDNYWPGSTETSAWKNVISLLTEAASVQLATPVFVEAGELSVSGKGISEYKKGINFMAPWPGGWWTLGDIVTYELESTYSMIKTGSLHKNDILAFRNDLCRTEVKRGLSQPPYFYIVPASQHDPGEALRMLQLLRRHGVALYVLERDMLVAGRQYLAGDFVIPMAQAYRPFIKEVMETQQYPVRRYTPGGEIIRPYDITSWSLPLHRGVNSEELKEPAPGLAGALRPVSDEDLRPAVSPPPLNGYWLLSADHNESFHAAFAALGQGLPVMRSRGAVDTPQGSFPAGSFLLEAGGRSQDVLDELSGRLLLGGTFLEERPEGDFRSLDMPRILLCETNMHDMDAGWTRWLFDSYDIPYVAMSPGEIATAELSRRFDVIVFPDAPKSQIMQGRSERGGQVFIPFYNPDYVKGLGKEGWQNVLRFFEQGGTILSWGRSVDLFTGLMEPGQDGQAYNLPVGNAAAGLERQGLNCPGSLLRMQLLQDHPLSLGMPPEIGVFHRSNPVLSTSVPVFGMDRRVVGMFPEGKVLMSGYAEKEELLAKRPAMVWVRKDKGQLVLYSFVPNFRGSMPSNNKLVFNALLLEKAD